MTGRGMGMGTGRQRLGWKRACGEGRTLTLVQSRGQVGMALPAVLVTRELVPQMETPGKTPDPRV